jgi:hypothetical protein
MRKSAHGTIIENLTYMNQQDRQKIQQLREAELSLIKNHVSGKFLERLEKKVAGELEEMDTASLKQNSQTSAALRFTHRLDQQFFQQLFFPEV